HRGAEIDRRGHRVGQGDHEQSRAGERELPADLSVRQALHQKQEDPRPRESGWPLADQRGEVRQVRHLALLLAALAFTAAAVAATPEDRLSAVFEAIEANQLDVALKRVDALIVDYPNFRLAHLVRGDLLLARARPLQTFGNVVKTVPQERVDGLREEALARLRAARQRPGEDRLPRYVLQLNPEQKHALVVD